MIGIDQRRRKPEEVKRTVEYRKGEALRICRESRLRAEDVYRAYKRLAAGEASFLNQAAQKEAAHLQ